MANGFGIGAAINKAYSLVNDPRESRAAQNQAMEAFRQVTEHDKQKEILAQQQVAAHQEQISKFADGLLGPDRDRINKKAKLLAQGLKENLSSNGNHLKYSSFMANGGISALQDYKSSVINSEESTNFLENKKNAEMLIKAQMSNMGHRINVNDLNSLRNYENNKGGKIQFTGLLNEIESPDPSAYDLGEDIPAEDILKNNYMAILGNYMTENPDSPIPSNSQLLAYTNLRHGGKGTSTKKMDDDYRRMKYENDMVKNLFNSEMQFNRSQPNQGQSPSVGNTQTPKAPTSPTGPTSPVGSLSNNVASYINNRSTSNVADFLEGKVGDEKVDEHLTPLVGAKPWDRKFRYFNPGAAKGLWEAQVNANAMHNFGNHFVPTNAVELFDGYQTKVAAAALGLDPNDKDNFGPNNVIKNWLPQPGVYLADGTKLDEDLRSNGADKKFSHDGSYRVRGVIQGGIASNSEGDAMVMDAYKGDKKLSREESMSEFKYSDTDTVKSMLFVVMEDEKRGNTFYVPLDISVPDTQAKIQRALGDADDLNPVLDARKSTQQAQAEKQAIADFDKKSIKDFRESFMHNSDAYKNLYQEINLYNTKDGYSHERAKLIESIYIATAQEAVSQYGGNVSDGNQVIDVMTNLTENSYFTNALLGQLKASGGIDFGDEFRKGINKNNDPNALSNEDLINKMSNADVDNDPYFWEKVRVLYKNM